MIKTDKVYSNILTLPHSSPRRLFVRLGTSRHHSEVLPSAYAAHGVANTITPVDYSNEDELRIGITALTWPTWAIPFLQPRFKLIWIIIIDENWIEIVKRSFPTVLILNMNHVEPTRLPTVDVIAYNGIISGSFGAPSFGSLCLFDWNFRAKTWSEWKISSIKVDHSKCGGVSNFSGIIKIAIHKSMLPLFKIPETLLDTYPASDLSAILSHTEKGIELECAPRLPHLQLPVVSKVTHGCFHPRGLFPTDLIDPHFVIPCVFTTSKWVKRRLSTTEKLGVFDVPISIIQLLSWQDKKQLANVSVVPTKCLTAIVHGIFLKGTIQLAGGGSRVVSRDSGNSRVADTDGNKLHLKSTNTTKCSTAEDEEIPGAWMANKKHNKDEKAAKNDDAEVPIHFWNDSLAARLGLKELKANQRRAMETLRSFSVTRIWRRNVTRCFCSYIRCKACHLNRLKSKFDYKARPTMFSCKRCKQHKKARVKDVVVWRKGKYEWRDEVGKLRYQKWYKIYRKKSVKAEAEEIDLDINVGVDCIRRAIACTAWNWPIGSRLFFWRWGEFRHSARDGSKIFIQGELPKYTKQQKAPRATETLGLVQGKLKDVRRKGYIGPGEVVSVTSMFDVPKGDDDIRLVYNATESGLNEAVWAPWFSLPTCESHLRAVDPGTYMGDADLGEMFLNFPLDKHIRKYAGVDFTLLFPDEGLPGETFWERWERMLMGFRPSPYCTTQDMRRIDLFLRGQADNPNNVFRWDKVVLNLPGMKNYTSTRPRVFRIRKDGVLAADLFSYIDDLRNTGPTELECWDGLHQVCSRLTWLGLQDAARKRNGPTLTPRAWAGSILHSDKDTVTVLVSEDKWFKTKKWIAWILEHAGNKEGLPYQDLLSCRGFLIYISRTYRPFKPYLRGLHKTIDSWRPYRDEEGWKMMQSILEAKLAGTDTAIKAAHPEPTKYIQPLERLKKDFLRLKELTKPEAPPKVVRRRKKMGTAVYGFGDASGKGFGNAIEVGGRVYEEFGQWSGEYESKHSNYKELKNLVNAVENAYAKGLLEDCELFLFTDNFVAECSYYNGGSNRSKELDELVHRLWRMQMSGDFTLHVYHVAGTRMIECGVDGLSRGDKSEGIAKGVEVLHYVPIHLNGIQRSPKLLDWIKSWWDEPELGPLHVMTPEDWFLRVMDEGNFLWVVPPSAGEAAVEQLCCHVHGRPNTHHLFVIPRLCTCSWRKQLLKVCDVVLTIQPQFSFWEADMHEPLLVGIYFPLLPPDIRFKPWQLKPTKFVERFKTNLHRMQAARESVDWNILRKFLLQARSIPTLPDGMARQLLQVEDRRYLPHS